MNLPVYNVCVLLQVCEVSLLFNSGTRLVCMSGFMTAVHSVRKYDFTLVYVCGGEGGGMGLHMLIAINITLEKWSFWFVNTH